MAQDHMKHIAGFATFIGVLTLITKFFITPPTPYSCIPYPHWNKGLIDDAEGVYSINITNLFSTRINSAKSKLLQIFPSQINVEKYNVTVIDALNAQYWSQIQSIPQIQTIPATLSKHSLRNILPKKFYIMHSNNCTTFLEKAQHLEWIMDKKCIQTSEYPFRTFEYYFSQYGIINSTGLFNTETNITPQKKKLISESNTHVDFLHIVKDAIILRSGDFFVDKYQIWIQRCGREFKAKQSIVSKNIPIFPEVYSIGQSGGQAYYHWVIEDLPRIVIGLQYLIKNKGVKIHVNAKYGFVKNYMRNIGINPNRLVTGTVRTKILLVPRGAPCLVGSAFNTNSLHNYMQSLSVETMPKQDTIILIKRSAKRWFNKHDAILKMIHKLSNKQNLRVQVFGDKPLMTLQETKKLFRRAAMVVAPHGAGLSNLIFSQRGTCVVEGLCYHRTGVFITCFQHLSYILGLRYHGVAKPYQCMNMQPEDLRPHILQCLNDIL